MKNLISSPCVIVTHSEKSGIKQPYAVDPHVKNFYVFYLHAKGSEKWPNLGTLGSLADAYPSASAPVLLNKIPGFDFARTSSQYFGAGPTFNLGGVSTVTLMQFFSVKEATTIKFIFSKHRGSLAKYQLYYLTDAAPGSSQTYNLNGTSRVMAYSLTSLQKYFTAMSWNKPTAQYFTGKTLYSTDTVNVTLVNTDVHVGIGASLDSAGGSPTASILNGAVYFLAVAKQALNQRQIIDVYENIRRLIE